ncbi:MAG: TolC family protein [Odoribacteraceae bacterium]|jgi:outer membrane protein TolC|nr:TolC family protein [Odoribacteraceae bacterium]
MKRFTLLLLFFAGLPGLFTLTAAAQEQDTLALTLDRALELASLQSPELMNSRRALQRSETQMINSKADLKPRLGLSFTPFSYDRSNTFMDYNSSYNLTETMSSNIALTLSQKVKFTGGTLNFSEGIDWRDYMNETDQKSSSTFSNRLSISYEQPIFKYNEVKMNSRQQELDLETSRLSYALQVIQLEQTVTNAFYGVYRSFKSVETAEDAYNNQLETYTLTKNKVESKLLAESELLQQEITLANRQDALASARDSYQRMKDDFKKMLGLSLDIDLSVIPPVAITPIEIDAKEAIRHALDQRLQLKQSEISLERLRLQLIQVRATDKFSGNLSFSLGFSGNDSKIEQVFNKQSHNEGVRVTLSIPIWDWGIRKNNIRNAELNIEESEINLDEARKEVEIRIRELCRNLPRYLNKIALSEKSIENAEITYKINYEKYMNGSLSSMMFKDYQDQLTSARQSYIDAIIDYRMQLLEIKIYTLWDFEKNESIVPYSLLQL